MLFAVEPMRSLLVIALWSGAPEVGLLLLLALPLKIGGGRQISKCGPSLSSDTGSDWSTTYFELPQSI